MDSYERTSRAIHFRGPDRIPLFFFNRDFDASDMLLLSYASFDTFPSPGIRQSEWGFEWKSLDDTMGQPHTHPIPTLDLADRWQVPDPDRAGRFSDLPDQVARGRGKYLLGSLGVTGFNQLTFLHGFPETLEDLVLEPEPLLHLLDRIQAFENAVIRRYAALGLHGIFFGDDWGTQQGLMIDPADWRRLFKPRYARQFELVHSLGLDVYFHCCGKISEILPDLVEIGADILNLNQPDLLGVEWLGRQFRGQVCFNCPVDHQTTAIHGSPDEIDRYVAHLVRHLATPEGGFIGYIEDYASLGMGDGTYRDIREAFRARTGRF